MASSIRAMAAQPLLRSGASGATSRISLPSFLVPFTTVRHASGGAGSVNREKVKLAKLKQKRKQRNYFRRDDMKKATTFSLCDAVRYLKAFEVGQNPESTKYEVHVSFKTLKSSQVTRGQVKMPHTVDASQKIAVICPPDSKAAQDALAAGASIVGEDDLLANIKEGKIEFQRLICHIDSQEKLKRANVGRTLGPKGMMPNAKTGTIIRDVGSAIANMVGGIPYRERRGVVRLAVGRLAFTPDMLGQNIKAFMDKLKQDVARLGATTQKEIHEVVLSSTRGPGFPLDGTTSSETSLSSAQLSVN